MENKRKPEAEMTVQVDPATIQRNLIIINSRTNTDKVGLKAEVEADTDQVVVKEVVVE